MTKEEFIEDWMSDSPYITVQTSGSTGKPKKLEVEKSRMLASAKMTCDFLGLKPGDSALLCMPLDYIAGKMMVVRSIERSMTLMDIPPSSHPLQLFVDNMNLTAPDFAAFVPMQVSSMLQNEPEARVFAQIKHVIIGGGAIDSELAARLSQMPNNVWSTYGMTETLSHIALRRLSGPRASDVYTPLPGVTLSLNDDHCLVIDAPHICTASLATNDIVRLNPDSTFVILGRKDNTINSGGIKIQIEEVEQLLRQHLSSSVSFIITSVPDKLLGEAVVMLTTYPLTSQSDSIIADSFIHLPKYWKPKRIIHVSRLPMTETGKPDRASAQNIAYAKIL